ncbi:MAG: hypothetical protein ACJAS4_002300 [Bacteriovoracaceae bacterium]|jgi:uncharacterized protein (TIRG00374 family)
MYKKIITNILKFTLAFGLIYWLVQSGKLDFKLLYKLIETPLVIVFSIALMQFDHILVALRLRIILLQKASNDLSFVRLFISNWIGIFFNSVLPGSVTGDVVKIFYIKDLDKNLSKKFLLISVLMDRVVGLLGLILIGGIVSTLNYDALSLLSNDVKSIIHINMFLMIIVFITLGILFFLPSLPHKIAEIGKKTGLAIGLINKLEEIWTDLCLFRNKLVALISMSMIIQALAIFIFWYLAHPFATGHELNISTVFSVMPIGFISLAIPIAPAGLGVGHVVFETLLGYFGVSNGASLFNIYFFVIMFSNLTGVLPYIFYSGKNHKKVHLNDIEKTELELENESD